MLNKEKMKYKMIYPAYKTNKVRTISCKTCTTIVGTKGIFESRKGIDDHIIKTGHQFFDMKIEYEFAKTLEELGLSHLELPIHRKVEFSKLKGEKNYRRHLKTKLT